MRVRRNKLIRADPERDNVKIIWGADDRNLYSFEAKKKDDTVEIFAVASYFEERYKKRLRFPKMPIVFLGNKEWFPVEFLFQSFGKLKNANTTEQTNAVLNYYDKNSGYYVNNIQDVFEAASKRLGDMGMTIDDVLKQYNLRRNDNPIQLEARILPEPKLRYGEQDAELRNGSWDVMRSRRGIAFNKPAKIHSFAVLNLLGRNDRTSSDFMSRFLRIAKEQGMEVPVLNNLNDLIVDSNHSSPDEVS